MSVVRFAVAAAIGLLAADPAPRAAMPALLHAADTTAIVLLGTGTPRPDPAAAGAATAVVVGHRVFLFDAGPGVERRLNAAGLPINGVTALFITHLHSDHTLGLPDLVFTSWVMGRRTPLQAYGPHGLEQMVDHIIAAWSQDIAVRTEGLEHETPGGYRVAVHEIHPGVVYDSGGVKVTAIPVLHGSWKEAYGYRIDTPDRKIVISGDTRPSAALAKAAHGVDVLIHEAYAESRLAPENRPGGADWPRY
ncbi:MAG: MBL fold metallo-hydrolase, partial [Gemmatimonadales bacterium]